MSVDDTATGAQSDEKTTSIMESFVVTVLEEYQGNAIKPVRVRIHAPPLKPVSQIETPWKYPWSSSGMADDLLWFGNSLGERQSELKKVLLYLRVPNVEC